MTEWRLSPPRLLSFDRAIHRTRNWRRLPAVTQRLAQMVHPRIPERLNDPEAVVRLADIGATLLAFGVILGLSLFMVLASVGVPSLIAIILAGLVAVLVTRLQLTLARWVTMTYRPVAAAIVSTGVSLLIALAALAPTCIIAVLVTLFINPTESAFLMRIVSTLLIVLVVTLPINEMWAAAYVTRRFVRVTESAPRFVRRYLVRSPLRPAQPRQHTAGELVRFLVAEAGGMSPANTVRYRKLWAPFEVRGVMVLAGGLLGFVSFTGLLVTTGMNPLIGTVAGLGWGTACVAVMSHALALNDTTGRTAVVVLTRIGAWIQCVTLGLVTAIAGVGATGLTDLTQTWPPRMTSVSSAIGIAVLVCCLLVFVLPLLRVHTLEGARDLYQTHQRIIDRARREQQHDPATT